MVLVHLGHHHLVSGLDEPFRLEALLLRASHEMLVELVRQLRVREGSLFLGSRLFGEHFAPDFGLVLEVSDAVLAIRKKDLS